MALVAVGLLCSVFISIRRIHSERAHRRIDIIVDYGDLRRLAAVDPGGVHAALKQMQDAGATGIAVYEDGFIEAVASGIIDYQQDMDGLLMRPGMQEYADMIRDPSITKLLVDELPGHYAAMLDAYFGPETCARTPESPEAKTSAPSPSICFVRHSPRELEELSLGFDIPETSLAVSLRPRHTPYDTPASIQAKMQAWDKLQNKSPVIFDGTAIAGFPNAMKPLLEAVAQRPGMRVGFLELVGQQGITTIANKFPEQVVQTHSITELEMVKIGRDAAMRRMIRAVRERRVQVLYLRLFVRDTGMPPDKALAYNVGYVRDVAEGVRTAGYTTGAAAPVKKMDVPWFIRAGAISGAFALVFLLAGSVFRVPWNPAVLVCALVFPGYALLASQGFGMLVLKVSALLVACLAPGLAVSALFLYPQRHYDGPGRTMPLPQNIKAFLIVCLLTSAAGFMAGSVISHRDFFVRIDMFSGVKLALVCPLLVVTYAWLRVCRFSIEEFLQSPLRYMEAVAGVAILAAAAIYLIRSGNDAAISPLGGQERNFREWLEAVFVVRPRTKEFLLGHPAMILLGLVPFHRKNYLFLVVLIAGTVGQASLFNTFCHVHTPLPLTLARVVLGVLLGTAVGAALRTVWIAAVRVWRREG
jgi:hypothetical protein